MISYFKLRTWLLFTKGGSLTEDTKEQFSETEEKSSKTSRSGSNEDSDSYFNATGLSSVNISTLKQFFKLTPEQTTEIKSISFDGLEISDSDLDFCNHWDKLFPNREFTDISFNNCIIVGYSLFFLNGVDVTNLSIKNCNLTSDQATNVLHDINSYLIYNVDFSHNRLGDDEEVFKDNLAFIFAATAIFSLNLECNGFSSSFKGLVRKYNQSWNRDIQL